ncbi:MAG: amino acid ABC transporter permease [Candidatus Borkfalkiaceae bacterium]|nr:amino acid ABC transporter permease [Christensenellaceae bacterium]
MDFISVTLKLLEGFGKTCEIFAITLVSALPLGLLVALGTMSRFRVLKYVLKTVIWVIRGTPLMLQVIVAYYGPALLFGWGVPPRMMAVLVAFVINYSCYFAEIYRGGIESVSKGQSEAGLVLGMTKSQIFIRIILLQVVKRIVPPMSNEIITLVKDTSLARVIVVSEILKVAQDFSAKGLIWPLFYTGAFYLVFVGILTVIFHFIEKKLAYIKV